MAAPNPTVVERARTFLDGVLAHVPEDQREAARAALTASPEALNALGNGVLRQDEFSRAKDDIARQRGELNTLVDNNRRWYEQSKPVVDRAHEIVNAGGGLINDDDIPLAPAGDPPVRPVTPVVTLTPQQLEERVQNSESGAVKFFGVLSELQAKHFQAFGEILNTAPLLDNPRLREVGLPRLYEETFADRYKAKHDAEQAKLLAEAEERGKAAGIAEMQARIGQQGPYPTPHAVAAVSPTIETLRQINTETGGDAAKLAQRGFKNRFDEHAAAAEYAQLVASGVGAGQG